MLKKILFVTSLATATEFGIPTEYPQDAQDLFAEGSESRSAMRMNGVITAAFTPVDSEGNLDFTNLRLMAHRL